MKLRIAELEEAYSVMSRICAGGGASLETENLRGQGSMGGDSFALTGVDWTGWKGRIDLEHVTVAGHSFGGVTAIDAGRRPDQFPWAKQIILYDIWRFALQIHPRLNSVQMHLHLYSKPLSPPEKAIQGQISATPLLCVNSEAFMYWNENYQAPVEICNEVQEAGSPSWLLTIRRTAHLTQTDLSLIFRNATSELLKRTASPARAIDLSVAASLEFLLRMLPTALSDQLADFFQGRGILAAEIDHHASSDRQPDPKNTAMRLQIKKEVLIRLKGGVRKQQDANRETLLEPPSDEIWTHVKPREGER